MPSSPPPTPEQIQAAQVAVATLASESVDQLWPGDDLADLAMVAADVRDHAQAAAALAVRQYRRQRQAAGATGTFRPRTAAVPSVAELEELLRDAGTQERAAEAAGDVVFDQGVRTILENADRDPQARGYARIPEADACAFCLMLASRGAVFKAQRRRGRGDSFAASNAKFKDGKDTRSPIKVHDRCRCLPEPVFGRYEMTARAREAEGLWKQATDGGKYAGDSARVRFRQLVEGRELTNGLTGDRRAKPTKKPSKAAPAEPGKRTREQVTAELTALEKRLPQATDRQREWLTNRIKTLRQQLTT